MCKLGVAEVTGLVMGSSLKRLQNSVRRRLTAPASHVANGVECAMSSAAALLYLVQAVRRLFRSGSKSGLRTVLRTAGVVRCPSGRLQMQLRRRNQVSQAFISNLLRGTAHMTSNLASGCVLQQTLLAQRCKTHCVGTDPPRNVECMTSRQPRHPSGSSDCNVTTPRVRAGGLLPLLLGQMKTVGWRFP